MCNSGRAILNNFYRFVVFTIFNFAKNFDNRIIQSIIAFHIHATLRTIKRNI